MEFNFGEESLHFDIPKQNLDAKFPLAKGMQGSQITALQNALNDFTDDSGNNLFSIPVTGIMDDATINALEQLNNYMLENDAPGISFPLTASDYETIVGSDNNFEKPHHMEFNFEKLHFDIPHFDKQHEKRHRHHKGDTHFEAQHFTSIPGWQSSLPNDPNSQVVPLTQVSPYTNAGQMPGAPWIYKVIDTNEATPRRFWYVVTPAGVIQNNNNGNQSEASATTSTDNDAFNDIFNTIFNQITGWLQANGFKGSSNVATLYRKLGMTGNWKDNNEALPAVGKYLQFWADLTGSSGNVYQANYKQPKGGLAKVGQDIAKDATAFNHLIDKAAKAAAKVLETAGEDVLMAPLLIFKTPMKNKLDREGIAHDNTLGDIAEKFAAHIGSHFEKYNISELAEERLPTLSGIGLSPSLSEFMFEGTGKRHGSTHFEANHLDAKTVQEIIHTILDFFRSVAGLPPGAPGVEDPTLQAQAAAQLAAADAAAKAAETKTKSTADAGVKGNLFGKKFDLEAFFTSPKGMIGVIVAILGFFAFLYWTKHNTK